MSMCQYNCRNVIQVIKSSHPCRVADLQQETLHTHPDIPAKAPTRWYKLARDKALPRDRKLQVPESL